MSNSNNDGGTCSRPQTILAKLRSAGRTLRRRIGVGPPKITSANVGTEASQCATFRRFEELYIEYYDSPEPEIRDALFWTRNYMEDMEDFLKRHLPLESSPILKSEINSYISNLALRDIYVQGYFKDLPPSLKEELMNYAKFVSKYCASRLAMLRDEGCLDLDAWIDCGLGLDRYPLPKKVRLPWNRRTRRRRHGLNR